MSIFQQTILKIQKNLNKENLKKKEIVKIISDTIKVSINEDQIIIKKGTISIKTAPIIRMEILIQKEKILSLFKENKIEVYSIL